MERNEDKIVEKIRIRKELLKVKKNVTDYLNWCSISGVKPDNPKSVNTYFELSELIMESLSDTLQNKDSK